MLPVAGLRSTGSTRSHRLRMHAPSLARSNSALSQAERVSEGALILLASALGPGRSYIDEILHCGDGDMAGKTISMRAGNKGLTVKINLWALDAHTDDFSSESARLCIKGQVTHGDTGYTAKFNDGGEILTIIGKWNAAKLRALRAGSAPAKA